MDLGRAVPVLTVADVPTAVSEYTSALGLDVLMDHGWIVTLGTVSGAQFSVMSRDETATVNPVASFQVDDVDAAYASVIAAGLDIVHHIRDEPWGVRRFFFRDSHGNVVNVLAHS